MYYIHAHMCSLNNHIDTHNITQHYTAHAHLYTHLLPIRLSSLHFSIKVGHHSNGLVQEALHILLTAVDCRSHTIPLPPLSTFHPIYDPQLMWVHCTKLNSLHNRRDTAKNGKLRGINYMI